MLLFIISLILICISSYFVASICIQKTARKGLPQVLGAIYFLLTVFSQVILSFEILSLFRAISPSGFILLNLIFFIISLVFWIKFSKPVYVPHIKEECIKIFKALKKDKSLILLGLCLMFFILISIIIVIFIPVVSYDALVYHLARVPFWLDNGCLNHLDVSDARMNVMPINSELLYAWLLLFFKSDWFIRVFSFISYLVSVVVLYNFLGELKFCTRKKLWSVFVFSSIASIIGEATGTETDILIGALVFASLYMFYVALKKESNIVLFFSSLAYALAVGTKTPAAMAIPVCALFMFYVAYTFKKKDCYKPILLFLGFSVLNFLIFSSYNYILNWVNYGNFFGSPAEIEIHSFYGGPKAFLGNLIRHIFLLFDFSGFNYVGKLGPYILQAQDKVLAFFGIAKDYGVIISTQGKVNNTLLDALMGPGVLGILVFIPCVFYSICRTLNFKANRRNLILGILGLIFVLNLIVLSGALGFMVYSVRFFTFFIIISSPIFAYSYIKSNKNIFKLVLIFYMISYLVVISSHLAARPFFKLIHLYKQEGNIHVFRERLSCSDEAFYKKNMPVCVLNNILATREKPKKIAAYVDSNFRSYHLKMMETKGWDVDFLLLEDIEKHDLDKYNYIVTNYLIQDSNTIKHPERISEYMLHNGTMLFSKNHHSNCFYMNKHNVLIQKGSKDVPVTSICYVPTNYIKKKGFKLIKWMKVDSLDQTPEGYKDILIYEKN